MMRDLSLHTIQSTREKRKVSVPNARLEEIFKSFNLGLEQVREENNKIKFLLGHAQPIVSNRQSQIILLVSLLDTYIHDIVKHCFIQMLNGQHSKTDEYNKLLIPMEYVESAIQNPESSDWLDEAITTIHQYKNFTSEKKIKVQLKGIGITEKRTSEIIRGIKESLQIQNPLNEIFLIRNRLAHRVYEDIEACVPSLTEEKVEVWIRFIELFVAGIHNELLIV